MAVMHIFSFLYKIISKSLQHRQPQGSHSHKLLPRPSTYASVSVTVGAAVLKLCACAWGGTGVGFTSYFRCQLHFMLFAAAEGWKICSRVRNRKTRSFIPSMAMNVSSICLPRPSLSNVCLSYSPSRLTLHLHVSLLTYIHTHTIGSDLHVRENV